MKPYPDCNHHDCHDLRTKLQRPWRLLPWSAAVIAGIAVFSATLLMPVNGQTGLASTYIKAAELGLFAPVLALIVIRLIPGLSERVGSGKTIFVIVSLLATMAFVENTSLASDYNQLVPDQIWDRTEAASWAVTNYLAAMTSIIVLTLFVRQITTRVDADQLEQVTDQCANSHAMPAIAVG